VFLATTGLTEFWGDKDEILFLGPWCTRNEGASEERPYRYSDNPWNDRERLHQAATYCDALCDVLLRDLTPVLNEIHRTSRCSRYWGVLIGHWLVRYVHAFHDRYVHLKSVFQASPSVQTICLDPADYLTPRDTADFAHLYTTDFYNLQLYSQILAATDRIFPKKSYPHFAARRSSPVNTPSSLKRSTTHVFERICRIFCPDILLCELYLDWRYVYRIVRATNFRASLFFGDLGGADNTPVLTDDQSRKRLSRLTAPDEFAATLISSLPQNFPQVYLEGYARLRKKALSGMVRFPKVVFSSSAWFFNETFKFMAAEAMSKGARLLGCQHGGGYGLWRRAPETAELKIVDRWFGWGWPSSNPVVAPLPNPKLSELNKHDYWSNVGERHGLLLVATEHPMYPYWLLSIPLGDQYEEYIRWRIRFSNALSGNPRRNLVLRLFPDDQGWQQAARMQKSIPSVQLDDHSEPFLERLRAVRLAVFDHPTTTFLEALAYNTPSVLFWNAKHWEVRTDALPYLQQLRDAGILYDNPEDAAAKASQIYENPSTWWLSESVQQARKNFTNRYARGSDDWLREWSLQLDTELAMAGQKVSKPQ
jgi:putative transferase (TIGR04331 family)